MSTAGPPQGAQRRSAQREGSPVSTAQPAETLAKAGPQLIGLIGGMGWESTALYYRYLNEIARARLGGHHSAHCILASLDFEPLLQAGSSPRGDRGGDTRTHAGRRLKAAGADFFLLTANSAHRVAAQVEAAVGLPLLHIAAATGAALQRDGRRRVGLLGTRHVTEGDAYIGWLGTHCGIEVVAPAQHDRERLHTIVIDELTRGQVLAGSRDYLLALVDKMQRQDLDAVIVGCTELPLLLPAPSSLALPCYDTAWLHASAALARAGIADATSTAAGTPDSSPT